LRATRRWVLAHALTLQLGAYIVRPSSAYQALELGVSPSLVGLVAASFAVVPLVLAVPVGRWVDSRHPFQNLLPGALLMILGGVGLLWWTSSLTALLVWNAVIGLGHLMGVLGEQTLVARSGSGALDAAFGMYTFVGSLGQAAGPVVLAVVGGSAVLPDSSALVRCYLGAVLVMTLTTLPLRHADHLVDPARPLPSWRASFQLSRPRRRRMSGALLVSMLVLAAVDLIQVYLPALGVERQLPSSVVGTLLAIRAGATMLSRLGLARMTARVGRDRLIVISSLVAAGSVAVLAFPVSAGVLAGALFVAGFALGIGQPLTMSVVTLTAPTGATSTWLGLRLTANRFGQSAIPALVTLVAGVAGIEGVFLATSIGLLATAAAAHVLLPSDK
jgi:MFS family permease